MTWGKWPILWPGFFGGKGGGGRPTLPMYGAESLSTANYYISAADPYPDPVSVTGGGVVCLVNLRAISTAYRGLINRMTNGPFSGWALDLDSSGSAVFSASNGVGAEINSPVAPSGAIDLDKWCHIVGWFDSSTNKLRIAIHGYEVGSGTAIVGYTNPSAPLRMGRRSDGFGCTNRAIAGFLTFGGEITAAEILAHRAACIAAGDIVEFTGASVQTYNMYSYKAAVVAGDVATLVDTIGGQNLTRTGAPTTYSDPTPLWGEDNPLLLLPHTFLRPDLGYVLNGANISSLTCQASGRTYTEATAANQPLLSVCPELLGAACMTLDGTADRLISTAAASVYKFLHTGAGQEHYIPFVQRSTGGVLGIAIATGSEVGTEIGFMRGYGNNIPTDYSEFFLVNGSGVRTLGSEVTPYCADNLPWMIGGYYKEGASPVYRHTINENIIASGARSAAPSAADPTGTLRIGQTPGALYKFKGDIAEVLLFDRVLTAPERVRYNAYATRRYGKGIPVT